MLLTRSSLALGSIAVRVLVGCAGSAPHPAEPETMAAATEPASRAPTAPPETAQAEGATAAAPKPDVPPPGSSRDRFMQAHFKDARTMLVEGKQYAEDLDIHSLRAQYRLAEARLVREESESGTQDALKLLEEAKSLAEKTGHPELVGEVHYELGETMVRLRRLRDAPEHYKIAEEKTREVFESLPETFREAYAARQRLRFRDCCGADAQHEGDDGGRDAGPAPLLHGRSLHGGVGKRALPGASSSGQTITFLPSCHWNITILWAIWTPS